MRVLSHGGGVQTRTLLHLVLEGRFERPDHVVFADTQAEPNEVYRALEDDRAACEAQGIPFHVVTKGDLSATDAWNGVYIPAFTVDEGGGKGGMLNRQCTHQFKVVPIRRKLRELGARLRDPAELWLGISTDEELRRKDSDVQFVRHRWPLLELGWSREDCLQFLGARGLSATKSACVFCPYRNASEWRRVKGNEEDWQAAVAYDEAVRDKRPKAGELFVHPSRVPLKDAPVEDDRQQPSLWDNECAGHCGL